MPRLFVGAPFPALSGFDELQRRLQDAVRGVKPVRLDQAHVTLKFLGEVSDAQVAPLQKAVEGALAGFEAHAGSASGVGAFPSARRARVVWVGLEGTRLPEMAEAVESACGPLGFAREARGFRPHMTLARLRDPADVEAAIAPMRQTRFGPVAVDRVVLFASVLTPRGPEYTPVSTWTLRGGPRGAG